MTTNRLTSSNNDNQNRVTPPSDLTKVEQRRQWWIDRGNRILWGEEACKDGSYCTPRRDMEWRHDGTGYYIADRTARRLAIAKA